jgi:hypothetical protein
MDHSRYLAYRSVGRSLNRTPEWLVDDSIRDHLQDIAEALLLTSDGEDAEHLRRDAALALSLLVGQRRCEDLWADTLWQEISDCGPRDGARPARRPRAVTFAGAL